MSSSSLNDNNNYIWLKNSPGPHQPSSAPIQIFRCFVLYSSIFACGLIACNYFILPIVLVSLLYCFVLSVGLRFFPSLTRYSPWPRWGYWFPQVIATGWQMYMSCLMELLGMSVTLSGDIITEAQRGEGALIICNHPSTADWLYLWSLFRRTGSLFQLKIVLKNIQFAPILGWALQCIRYLFLQRDFQADKIHIEDMIQHWRSVGASGMHEPIQLLLFPEGTDLRPESYQKSKEFMEKSGTHFNCKHTLMPRTTGFIYILKCLQKYNSIQAVYDCTLAYTPFPISLWRFFRGSLPSSVHVHLKRYPLHELPIHDAADNEETTEKKLSAWLLNVWKEKESRLDAFYSTYHQLAYEQKLFNGSPNEILQYVKEKQLVEFESTPEQKEKIRTFTNESAFPLWLQSVFLISIFTLLALAFYHQCYYYPFWTFITHTLGITVWTGLTYVTGGLHKFIIKNTKDPSILKHINSQSQ